MSYLSSGWHISPAQVLDWWKSFLNGSLQSNTPLSIYLNQHLHSVLRKRLTAYICFFIFLLTRSTTFSKIYHQTPSFPTTIIFVAFMNSDRICAYSVCWEVEENFSGLFVLHFSLKVEICKFKVKKKWRRFLSGRFLFRKDSFSPTTI